MCGAWLLVHSYTLHTDTASDRTYVVKLIIFVSKEMNKKYCRAIKKSMFQPWTCNIKKLRTTKKSPTSTIHGNKATVACNQTTFNAQRWLPSTKKIEIKIWFIKFLSISCVPYNSWLCKWTTERIRSTKLLLLLARNLMASSQIIFPSDFTGMYLASLKWITPSRIDICEHIA